MQNAFFREFVNKNPLYKKIRYKNNNQTIGALLHPILIYSQAVIDQYLSEGKKRIAIVLPDDETNILPMVIAKYFSSLQEDPNYAHNVFEDIEPGQHLKLGKSVVEFLSIDKDKNVIEFYAGKPTKMASATKYTSPLQNYYLYFERTNASPSKEQTFEEERRRIKEKLAVEGIVDFDLLALKRTTINKTVAVLSQKNEFKEYLNELYVYNRKLSDCITYGEFDLDEPSLVRLFNSGQLDCMPGVTLSTKLNELAEIAVNTDFSSNIHAIFSTQSKFNDIINNIDQFKKCLKSKIPFIAFVSETEFETFPVLSELGFEFLHWDKELLNDCGFSSESLLEEERSIFHKLAKKTYLAAMRKSLRKAVKFDELKDVVHSTRSLLKSTMDSNDSLRQIAFSLNRFYKYILDLSTPNQGSVSIDLSNRFSEIQNMWNRMSNSYAGTETEQKIQRILDSLQYCLSVETLPKVTALHNTLSENQSGTICIIVPNRYIYKDQLTAYVKSQFESNITVFALNEFYAFFKKFQPHYDMLIVTFFDASEHLKIKNTFCYDKITYLLYDVENTWYSSYVNRFHTCLPADSIRKSASVIGISRTTGAGDQRRVVLEEEYEEINDYNFERNIVKGILGKHSYSATQADSVECIPIIFDQDTVGYFNPTHSVIEISSLCNGDMEKPVKKEARKIAKGDIILIRQSGRDIVFEKADELMERAGMISLRTKSEKWVHALQKASEGKEIDELLNVMLCNGAECTAQQLRYWLIGDTIRPEKINVLNAISAISSQELPGEMIDEVYAAGAQVQEFHREAGRWLSSELKNKAQEIKAIYQQGDKSGTIDGIGEVQIYVVEETLEKEYVNRGKVNSVEVII